MVITSTQLIGYIAVDSGQVLITDPGYLNGWGSEGFGEAGVGHYSYGGACSTTLTDKQAGQLNFAAGHAGAGVVSSTGLGDGMYPVYAHYWEDEAWGKRISRLEIVFIEDEDEDGEDD
jgi:hypothetical protein